MKLFSQEWEKEEAEEEDGEEGEEEEQQVLKEIQMDPPQGLVSHSKLKILPDPSFKVCLIMASICLSLCFFVYLSLETAWQLFLFSRNLWHCHYVNVSSQGRKPIQIVANKSFWSVLTLKGASGLGECFVVPLVTNLICP